MERLSECDVAPIRERGDDKSSRVSKILVGILELGITDVGKAFSNGLIPPVSQLRQPHEVG